MLQLMKECTFFMSLYVFCRTCLIFFHRYSFYSFSFFPCYAYFSFGKIFLGAFKLLLPHFLCLFFSENFNPFSVGNRACTQGRKCRSHRQTFFLFHKLSYQSEILFEGSRMSYFFFAIFFKLNILYTIWFVNDAQQ